MQSLSRLTFCLVFTMLAGASVAPAECAPSGRKAFVTGLEALERADLAAAARIFYRLVETQPRCAEARNNLAVVFVEQGRLEEARDQLRQALDLQPDYRRAQINLERVQRLLDSQKGMPRPEGSTLGEAAAPAVQAQPPGPSETLTKPPEGNSTPLERKVTPEMKPMEMSGPEVPRATATPADGVLLGPPAPAAADAHGAAACVIEPSQNRLCVSQRAAGAISTEECYEITTIQVRAWPRWIVASEVSPKRIRLLDESGQIRLEIVTEDGPVSGDALRVRSRDLETLATKIVPWRTGWLILQ